MTTARKAANAAGGSTARPCDSCMVKRARWFCGADDAFLCQKCDASVHSANLLASRHERVHLKSSSSKSVNDHLKIEPPLPSWQQGVTRKARTPRGHGNHKGLKDEAAKVVTGLREAMPFVPEIGSEEVDYFPLEDDHESEDLEQLLYRVPIFDPFEGELCNNMTSIDLDEAKTGNGSHEDYGGRDSTSPWDELDGFQGLMLPSEMELAEFALDVKNMFGKKLDDGCSDINVLGLVDEAKEEEEYGIEDRKGVKVEVEDHQGVECEINPSMMDRNFNYDEESAAVLLGGSSTDHEEEEDEKVGVLMEVEKKRKKICLRLNHEAVISEWSSKGCPWTTGVKPELNANNGWPDCMGVWGANQTLNLQGHGDSAAAYRVGIRGELRAGREARVSRYREKRRTRLFSKKIRYEVRKLNAEKRPRMKGRFVKRTSFQMGMGTTSCSTVISNAPPYQQHQLLKK